jgi:hypothetical protein
MAAGDIQLEASENTQTYCNGPALPQRMILLAASIALILAEPFGGVVAVAVCSPA